MTNVPTTDDMQTAAGLAGWSTDEWREWYYTLRAEVAAKALRDAADALDALTPETIPSDPRWTCDLGYYGEANWLRDYADRPEG